MVPEAKPKQGDDLEAAVDTAIAACDGDLRQARDTGVRSIIC